MDSELDIEQLRHIIDVSRTGIEDEKQLIELFYGIEARLKNKDSPEGYSYKTLSLGKGLDYLKEYPDIAVKYNRHVVFHRAQLNDP